jgi:hypothetical protein
MNLRISTLLAIAFLPCMGCRPTSEESVNSGPIATPNTSVQTEAPKRVDSLTFELALENGKFLTFRDHPVDGENYVVHEYLGRVPGIGYHLIYRRLYETGQYLLVQPRTGITTVLVDSPLVSPDQKRVLVESMDLEIGESPTVLEVWQVTSDSLRLEFQVETGSANPSSGWGPSDAHWVTGTVATFMRNYPIPNTPEMRQSPAWLVLQPSGWRIQDQRP